MKKTNILVALLSLLVSGGSLVSCQDEYSRPPLTEPTAPEGLTANITIAELKEQYKDVTKDAPKQIDVDYVLKATVIGNDVSGNIYKQLYIQDQTGGINIGVDQNSLYTQYRVGQQLYLKLKGLYVVNYGDQLQIGFGDTQANRIAYELFQQAAIVDGWPKEENATPTKITLGELNDKMVNTLVELDQVYFETGGKEKYSEPGKTVNRTLKDGAGNSIIVRNSGYASFANEQLPEGAGKVVGILSKFRSDWQLLLRSIDDVQNFGQPIPGGGTGTTPAEPTQPINPDQPQPGTNPEQPQPTTQTLYSETFGDQNSAKKQGTRWPLFQGYTGFSNKTVTYTEVPEKGLSVRVHNKNACIWFAAGKDLELKVSGIDTSASAGKELAIEFEVGANLYNATDEQDLATIQVVVDDQTFNVPTKVLKSAEDKDKNYLVTFKGVPAKKDVTVSFKTAAATNKKGLRLFNIRIYEVSGNVEAIQPKK